VVPDPGAGHDGAGRQDLAGAGGWIAIVRKDDLTHHAEVAVITRRHGVSPTDPLTFGSFAVGLAVVALVASYLSARRAAGVDPVVALRLE
jgi:hypothetical protein